MPVYKQGKNKWRVRIWVNGVRQPDEVFAGTMAEAKAHEARRRVELEKGAVPVSDRAVPTFRAFCLESF
ncbi:MAG: hypothetical protein FJ109_20230, partial [Deltaproteobacteria bacterium]|nr:hypothetical protein [Deltaproteobacteria bacterium]